MSPGSGRRGPLVLWDTGRDMWPYKAPHDEGGVRGNVQWRSKRERGVGILEQIGRPEGSVKLVQTFADKKCRWQKNGTVMRRKLLHRRRFVRECECVSVFPKWHSSRIGWITRWGIATASTASAEDKPSLENGCAKLHNATRWEGAAGVCACACVCWGGGGCKCVFYFYSVKCFSAYVSSHPTPSPSSHPPSPHLIRLCSLLLLSCKWGFFFFPHPPSHKMRPEQLRRCHALRKGKKKTKTTFFLSLSFLLCRAGALIWTTPSFPII